MSSYCFAGGSVTLQPGDLWYCCVVLLPLVWVELMLECVVVLTGARTMVPLDVVVTLFIRLEASSTDCCTTSAALSVIKWIWACCSWLFSVDSLLCVFLISLVTASLIFCIILGDSCVWFVAVEILSVCLCLDPGGITIN